MSTPKDGHHCARVAVAMLASAAVLLAPAPPSASANSYHDFLCRIPYGPSAGRAAPVDDVTYSTSGTFVFAGDGCAERWRAVCVDGRRSPPRLRLGGWDTFTAPAGLTISGFTLWRYEADGPCQPYGSPASNLDYSPGPPSVQGLCAQSLGCSARGTLATHSTRQTPSASQASAVSRRSSGAGRAAADRAANARPQGPGRSPRNTTSTRRTSTSSITRRRP